MAAHALTGMFPRRPGLYLKNATSETTRERVYEYDNDGGCRMRWRVYGVFTEYFELDKFPFDVQAAIPSHPSIRARGQCTHCMQQVRVHSPHTQHAHTACMAHTRTCVCGSLLGTAQTRSCSLPTPKVATIYHACHHVCVRVHTDGRDVFSTEPDRSDELHAERLGHRAIIHC